MDDIRSLLGVAARRLDLGLLFAKLHEAAFVAACIALALMIADRLPAAPFVPWSWVLPILAVLTVFAAIVMWRQQRKDESAVALLVDERLDLREKLSTALAVQGREDAFARAAVEDAVLTSRDPRNRERIKRVFTIDAPRGWWAGPLVILLVFIVSFLPSMDAFSRAPDESTDVTIARMEVAETLDAVVRSITEQPELSSELSDLLGEMTHEATDRDTPRSPEQIRREAIKRVTDLNDRLEEIVSGERGKSSDALKEALRQLDSPKDGEAREFADALASGDFSAAKKALEEMIAKIESGELNDEQLAALADQMSNIAEQLEQLAQQQKELEESLQRAGMDPQLASNPDALREAIENNENLNEQQKQQLQQMAQAQQAAQSMCRGLSGACSNLAQAMQDGNLGQAAGQLGDQLSDLEQMQMLLQQAQAAMNACKGSCQGLGQGLGLQQAMQQWRQGMGAGGQGGVDNPGVRGVAPTPTRTRIEQAKSQTVGDGDIIARMLIDGPQVVGESRVTPSRIVAEVAEGFEEGLTEEHIPRKYHDAQKRYFGELERRAKQMDEQPKTQNESSE